ncbi:hypothetical protein RDWZM_001234 [Blomia tropicalis]|uniref:Uncharacterized protein n=1 Tax=Blomia tropicalis TaxID=40697 RepID=A0A9Q0MBM4_BLOTA|nr:hypothetical protein RDWZM_001234 [Blomia tropicalis]
MTTAEKICKKINSYLRTVELIISEKGDATPYLEKLELWIEQLPTEAEETIQKYYERLSIWSAKAAVLETQRKMTLDRLRIEEAAKHGRTQRTEWTKIELAKHDGKPETFHAF